MKNKLFITALLICLFAAPLFAGLTISPARVEVMLSTGGAYQNYFELTNNYDGDVNITVSMSDWMTYAGNKGVQVSDWLTVDTEPFTLGKGESKRFNYSIEVKPNMVGQLGAYLSFTLRPPGNDMFLIKSSIPVYAAVYGTQKIDFKVLGAKFTEINGYLIGFISVQNKGNVNIRPKGSFSVKGPNKFKYIGEIREEMPVYAESTSSEIQFALPKGLQLAPGKYIFYLTVGALGKTQKKTVSMKIKDDGSIENL